MCPNTFLTFKSTNIGWHMKWACANRAFGPALIVESPAREQEPCPEVKPVRVVWGCSIDRSACCCWESDQGVCVGAEEGALNEITALFLAAGWVSSYLKVRRAVNIVWYWNSRSSSFLLWPVGHTYIRVKRVFGNKLSFLGNGGEH